MNVVFVHIATMNNYKEIVDDIINKININMINDVDKVYLCYIGNKVNHNYGAKYQNLHLSSNIEDCEFPTLRYLQQFCKANNAKVLYLHTKGASHGNKCVDDWRNYMLYFLVEKFSKCLEVLDSFDTCGVDLRDEPTKHYSGNFWAATSNHINTLPKFEEMPVILTERHKAEFWICSKGANHHSLWDCGISQYERHLHEYPKEKYTCF